MISSIVSRNIINNNHCKQTIEVPFMEAADLTGTNNRKQNKNHPNLGEVVVGFDIAKEPLRRSKRCLRMPFKRLIV
jgi:hypothetical protein